MLKEGEEYVLNVGVEYVLKVGSIADEVGAGASDV